ncbi:MAG: tetratricopeptide repeat protein [Gemmatimonadales bacterium]|jgi:tetratricopeptide (TPR) repeat protein
MNSSSILGELTRRRVPQILGIYLAAGWAVLEFTDFLVQRYILSPHLTDFALLAWALLVPSVLMLAYFHGAPGRDEWRTAEKLGLPLNLALAAVILFATFSNKDLGAATTAVTVRDETGSEVERVVPKSAFRKRLALFYFANESGDSALDWLQYGIPIALVDDLLQDIFIDVRTGLDFSERLEQAGYPLGIGLPLSLQREIADDLHVSHFVSGTVRGSPPNPEVTVSLHDVERGKLVEERIYTGDDVFELVDRLSLQLKRDLGIPEQHIEESRDLPVAEMMTASIPAFRHLVDGWRAFQSEEWQGAADALAAAVEEDPAFAFANLLLFQARLLLNDVAGGSAAIEAAMQHAYKLPERFQFQMKAGYYRLVRQDIERTRAVAGMFSELFPDDKTAHLLWFQLHMAAGERVEAIAAAQRVLELDPSEYDLLPAIGALYEAQGDVEEAERYYERYADAAPSDPRAFDNLGDLNRRQGDHDRARRYYERALALEPGDVPVLTDLARNATAIGDFEAAETHLAEALEATTTSFQLWQAHAAYQAYFARRGQWSRAIESMHQSWGALAQAQPPLTVVQQKLEDLDNYVRAGRAGAARATLDSLAGQLTSPLDLLLALGELGVAIELDDTAAIERASAGMDTLISTLGLESLRPRALYGRGYLLELRDDCDQAVIAYRRALELAPANVAINYDIGRCYRQLEQLDSAQHYLDRVLEVEPFAPMSSLEAAKVSAARGDTAGALEHLDRALRVWERADPDYAPAREARELQASLLSRS